MDTRLSMYICCFVADPRRHPTVSPRGVLHRGAHAVAHAVAHVVAHAVASQSPRHVAFPEGVPPEGVPPEGVPPEGVPPEGVR
jgi:hypothetical protein